MSSPNDPTYDAAAAEAAAAAAIADATAAAAAGAPPVPPSPIVPTKGADAEAAAAEAEAEASLEAAAVPPLVPATAPRYTDADLHRHDVLSGRGGYVNAHPGNHHLRTLCAYRKSEWDDGSNATKRRIAIEIYDLIRRLDPPGRFLKKEMVPGSAKKGAGGGGGAAAKGGKGAEDAETSATATAAAVAAETIAGAMGGDSGAEASAAAAAAAIAAGDSETASSIMAPSVLAVAQAKAQAANAPWVELNEEKSIQKAMQVMRDYKRDDRKERDNKPGKRKRANLPRGGGLLEGGEGVAAATGAANTQADGYDEQMREQHREAARIAEAYEAKGGAAAAEADVASAAADAKVYAEGCTNGIVPTNVDVLTGRGAFINDHPGNKYWRSLAQQNKARFDAGDQTEKKDIAQDIVRAVTAQAPTGGRFLRKIDPTPTATGKRESAAVKAARAFALTPRGFQGPWEVMDDSEARMKTIQTLRDMGRDKSKNKKRKTTTSGGAAKPSPAAAAMPPMPAPGASNPITEPDYTKPLADDQQQMVTNNPVIDANEHAAV